jgi:hypothetical protein
MFNLKKFIAFIGIEDSFMQEFYDKAEGEGRQPKFDIYHILDGYETPNFEDIRIMEEIYNTKIKGTGYEQVYETADKDFWKRLKEKNEKRTGRLI